MLVPDVGADHTISIPAKSDARDDRHLELSTLGRTVHEAFLTSSMVTR
jgi:hypothetical protein